MNPVEVDFIEKFGLMLEEDGMPRIAGRIFGLLMLSEEPQTLDDLSETLQISKASASTNTRLLDNAGVVERTTRPGDRRTFYLVSPAALERSFDRLKNRTEFFVEILDGLEPGLDPERKVICRRIQKMRRWQLFVLEELDDLLRRWQEKEAGGEL